MAPGIALPRGAIPSIVAASLRYGRPRAGIIGSVPLKIENHLTELSLNASPSVDCPSRA
jgi:hypothetical protein